MSWEKEKDDKGPELFEDTVPTAPVIEVEKSEEQSDDRGPELVQDTVTSAPERSQTGEHQVGVLSGPSGTADVTTTPITTNRFTGAPAAAGCGVQGFPGAYRQGTAGHVQGLPGAYYEGTVGGDDAGGVPQDSPDVTPVAEAVLVENERWWTKRSVILTGGLVLVIITGLTVGLAVALSGGSNGGPSPTPQPTTGGATPFPTTSLPEPTPTSVPTRPPTTLPPEPTPQPTLQPTAPPTPNPTLQPTPLLWSQLGQDLGGEAGDRVGNFLSFSRDGTVFCVGSISSSSEDVGRVRVYRLEGGSLTATGQDLFDPVADSCALSGDGQVLARGGNLYDGVGGQNAGFARVYGPVANSWIKIGDDFEGEAREFQLGRAVALSSNGKIFAVSAQGAIVNNVRSGSLRVYYELIGQGGERVWSPLGQPDIPGEASGDWFGHAIALNADGEVLAGGSRLNDATFQQDSGHVRVYRLVGGNWEQLGDDIDAEKAGELFGQSLALSANGNIVAGGTARNGSVRVFEWTGTSWRKIGQSLIGDGSDLFGHSISLNSDGDILAVGAYNFNNGTGRVLVYKLQEGTWVQLGQTLVGDAPNDHFGLSVALAGTGRLLAVGAPMAINSDGENSGVVRVYALPQ